LSRSFNPPGDVYQCLSNTPNGKNVDRIFRVNHPFHPLFGRQFEWIEYGFNWGENRVFYLNDNSERRSMPAEWTDLCLPDHFLAVSQGRARLRTSDLLVLAKVIEGLRMK
jgi:hypothetical protein